MTTRKGSRSVEDCDYCHKPIRRGWEYLAHRGGYGGNILVHRVCGEVISRHGGRLIARVGTH